MLRIIAVGSGAVDYLIRGSGCAGHEHAQVLDAGRAREQTAEHAQERSAGAEVGPERGRGAARYFGAAVESGEPAGRWGGRGLALFGIEEGAQASEGFVRSVFGKLEDPRTGESLGRAPRKFKDTAARVEAGLAAEPDATPERRREIELAAATDGRRAVAYYDFTFSPPKSVSVYYAALLAAGDVEGAAQVARAHDRAVEIAMAYAEEHIGYTRTGYHGKTVDGRSVGRYEAGSGLIWTGWKHSTNRENEPQLHTHVAVLNRLRTLSDGLIRALDGRGIRPVKEAIATAYERALEEEVVAARGVVFADRGDGKAREIVGVDQELCADASTRRAQTVDKAQELTATYITRNGHEPDAAALKAIMTDASLATRKPKDNTLAGPAAVLAWGQLDPDRAARLVATVEAVADAAEAAAITGHPDQVAGLRLDPAQPEQRAALLAAAIADVQHEYATWTVGNLVAAIDRRVGPLPAEAVGQARPLYLEALAREAVEPGNAHGVMLLTAPDPVTVPAELRRSEDGRSIFRPHMDERFATLAQLQAEERIVTAARQLTAPAIRGPELELLRVELAAAGLGPDQVAAVAGIVSSGRAGDVLIGPAGTGKSYTVSALADVWSRHIGARVLGLAPTEIAAQNLAEDGVAAMNTARFLALYGPGPDGEPPRHRVGRGDMFIVDEAGMASSEDRARICDIVTAGGGKIVDTGDHAQLSAVGAGGMLGLLAADNGAFELAEVHRFNNDWERDASLRLRAGDTSVIPEYEDRGRLHGGTREQMQAAAMRGYLADTLAGKESLLIVGSNADAAELSREIRKELMRYGRVDAAPLTRLGMRGEKVEVSIGDVVQARMVDRTIRVDGGGIVANRATYTVLGLDEDGALRVRGARGEIAHLPRSYVDQHLTLAYASTVHAAQSRTVDTSHALLDEAAAREAAYVALSRGREANTAYLVAQRDPDAHQPERLDGTAAGRLAGVLGNVEARNAAEVERRIGARDGASLGWIGTQWDEVSKDSAQARYTETLAGLLPPDVVAQVTAEAGWPRLVRAVREVELAGHNPHAVLAGAVQGRSLGDANEVSDVLRWRVRVLAADRIPEQHVQVGDWTALAPPVDGPVGQFSHELAVLAQDRQHELGQAALDTPPGWALAQLGPVPTYDDLTARVEAGMPVPVGAVDEVAAARVDWATRAGAVAAYRELRGIAEDATSIGAAPSREQEFHRQMWTQAAAALGQQADPGAVDYRTLPDLDLYAVRDRWTREQQWAPEYVATEMRTAYQLGREYTEDAALAGARLATLEPTDPEWEPTAAQLARSERLAELSLERARQLDEIHHARGGWYGATEDARIADEAARDELGRRGLPVQRVLVEPEQLELFDPADVADPAVEATEVELDAARKALDDPQLAADIAAEPVADRAPESRVDEPTAELDRELDDVELEEQLAVAEDTQRAAQADRDVDADRRPVAPEPVEEADRAPELVEVDEVELADMERADAERERVEAEPADVEQLALLDIEPRIEDEVGAAPLRELDPAEQQAAAEREQQEQRTRATLAEARQAAEAAEQQRLTRDAVAEARAAVAALMAAEAERERRDEAERQEQLIRWHEQDRAAEQERGLDDGWDDGPSIDY